MVRIMMKYSFFVGCLSLIILGFSSCGGRTETMEGHTDSARIDSSVIAEEDNGKSEDDDEPPAAADRLFDDFIYAFMHTRSFQLSRIKFPLMNLTDGKDSPVKKEDWKYDKLYSGEDTYMMLFDDVRSTVCEKDTSLHHADVEFIDLGRKRVKQYSFDKEKGKWLLTKIDIVPV